MNYSNHLTHIFAAFLLFFSFSAAQQSNDDRVMLQGFYWESAANNPDNWYNIINSSSQEIADMGIDMIWLPPPSDAGSLEGYLPRELNNFANSYGDLAAHQGMLNALNSKGIEAIADIVVNHRVGNTNYVDFANPAWGTDAIVSNDEVWSVPQYYNVYPRGANDTGTPYDAARDIDHTKPYVQNSIIDFLNNLKTLGYSGWRYDFVHGFDPYYFSLYNNATSPSISVGENYNSDKQVIQDWIDNSGSTAFDFPTYFTLKSVVRDNNYSYLSNSGQASGGIGWDPKNNVTFVENHDTPRYDVPNNVLNSGNVGQTYAYLLTHPGVPCIYWPHLMDWGNGPKTEITDLIHIRKDAGIHSQSNLTIEASQNGLYAAVVDGDNFQVAMKMGPNNWSPSGSNWNLVASGNNYAVWSKSNPAPPSGIFTIYTQEFNTMYSWDANQNATNGAWPGVNLSVQSNGWKGATVSGTCTNLIFSNNGAAQTADLTTCSDTPYYYQGSWYATDPTLGGGNGGSSDSFKVFTQEYATIYSWDDVPNATNGNWPGTNLVDEGNGWYSAIVPGSCSNLIFSNNGADQTPNLNTCDTAPYYYQGNWFANDPTGSTTVNMTVYVEGYTHLYSWDDNQNATNGPWPGTPLTATGNGYGAGTIPSNCSNLIFSNNGSNQTANLSTCSNTPYFYNNQWNAGPQNAGKIHVEAGLGSAISVFPNPLSEDSVLRVMTEDAGTAVVQLFHLNGQLLGNFPIKVRTGINEVLLSQMTEALSSGVYICKMEMGGISNYVKLVKN